MKKIKLFLAAMAAMVTMGVNAQSWTASEVGAGSFYLYNVGTGQYFTKGNGWGTQASITTDATPTSGLQLTLEAVDTNFKIRTDVGTSGYGAEHLSDGTIYTDQSRDKNSTWTFTQVDTDNGPVYTIVSADNHGGGSGVYMTASSGNTIVAPGTDGTTAYAQWKLLDAAKAPLVSKIAEYQEVRATVIGFAENTSAYTDEGGAADALNAAVETQDDAVASATTTTEIDNAISAVKAAGNTFLESVIITSGFDITNVWITNPAPYADANGWTLSSDATYDSGNQCAEYWNKSGASIKQTLSNLPKGAYRLRAIALTRTDRVATLSAGSASMSIATVDNGTVNSRDQAKTWFNNGNGVNDLNFTLSEAAASLEIGLTADNTTADYWMVWRSFNLTYYGDPINLKKAELAEAVAAAQAIDESTISTAAKAEIDAVVTEQNKTYSTEAEYDAAISAINTAVSTYASAEIVAAYVTVINAKALYNQTDYTDKDDAKATFKALIDAADATTNVTDLNAAVIELKAGLTPFISTVTLNENAYFDVTDFFVVNPSVSVNTTGWTAEENGSAKTSGSWAVCNYGECEFYNNNFKFYQTLALSTGTWEFGVTGFHRAGNHSTYFYAGEDKILIPGVERSVVNTMAAAKTYFDNGNGKVSLKFLIEEAGDVEIGIDNQDTETDKWTIFRNFTLKYYGAPDYAVYDEQLAAAVAEAEAIKGTVPAAVYTTLSGVVTENNKTYTKKADYLAAIEAIESATTTAKATQSAYAAYLLDKSAAETLAAVTNDNDDANDELVSAISTAVTDAEAATTAEDINTAAATLKLAMTTYVFAANPVGDGAKFDLTFLLTNPDLTNLANWASADGWYTDQTDGNSQVMSNDAATSEDGTKTKFYEYWSNPAKANNAFTLYQKVTLPAGTYDISCYAFAQDQYDGSNTVGVYFYANDTQGSSVTTTRLTEASLQFINDGKQEVKIGLKAITGNTYNWMGIGYVTLKKVPTSTTTYAIDASATNGSVAVTVDGEDATKALALKTVTLTVTPDEGCVLSTITATYNDGENVVNIELANPSTNVYTYQQPAYDVNVIVTCEVESTDVKMTIAAGKYGTFIAPFDVTIPDGVTASTITGVEDNDLTLTLTPVKTTIPANTPVVVYSGDAVDETFYGKSTATSDSYTVGLLTGVYTAATISASDDDATRYVLQTQGSVQAFYKVTSDFTATPNRCYLTVENSNNVKAFFFGDIETGIEAIDEAVNGKSSNGKWYNLAGQRVTNAQKGLYIVNGKKVVK